LENALYNKFQALGLVPPHVKDIIRLREDVRDQQESKKSQVKSSQIGAIVFVDEANTSKDCPYCEKKQEGNHYDEKFRQHRFICTGHSSPCGFDTYHFKPEEEQVESPNPEVQKNTYRKEFELFKDIDDPDKVAAYNIAKKITDPDKIGKMKNSRRATVKTK